MTRNKIRLTTVGAGMMLAHATLAGEIVVGHDVNTFSDSISGPTEQQYAINIANHLTGGGGDLLLIASGDDPLRNFGQDTISALQNAGFGVTHDLASDGYASEIANLNQYDAVFFGAEFGTNAIPDANLLHNFVNSGGGAYVAGGTGPDALAEAVALNQFLMPYGVMFHEVEQYNRSLGFEVDSDDHPIFDGLMGEFIGASNGSAIVSMNQEDGNSEVFFDDRNGFAQVSTVSTPVIPAPGALAVLGLAAAAGPRRRR